MKHIGLFEGIGGFSLAARWMGWETIAWCEWNPFCQKVLNYHFPKAKQHGDITTTDFTIYRGQCDILTGGFPCQPYSVAGKRLGKEDERHLWPHMLRAIREIKPYWVVGENVSGLINWNGGVVFDEVQTDLENEGYEVIPFVLPACGVDAPHKRDRVWFIAKNTLQDGWGSEQRKEESEKRGQRDIGTGNNEWLQANNGEVGDAANPNGTGWEELNIAPKSNNKKFNSGITMHSNSASIKGEYFCEKGEGKFNGSDCGNGINRWENFPTQSPVCNGNDGLSDRLDGITFSKWRNESIKAGGNAIVPQVALQIFKAINQFNNDRIS